MAATKERARARMRLIAATRASLGQLGYEEVETPALVPAPGMEPHIAAFETPFVPDRGDGARRLYLHTSPEYAMKRLVADGWSRIFQLCKVFRNGEVATQHNPEFTMLELYSAGHDYTGTMADLERVVEAAVRAAAGDAKLAGPLGPLNCAAPFERLTVQEAFTRHAGVDPFALPDPRKLREAARRAGVPLFPVSGEHTWSDVFFEIMLTAVEPHLGRERPTFLVDWPPSEASLSRLRQGTPTVAERFELYAQGLELANGFSELTDAAEQRRRLVAEQTERRRLGHAVYPLDEKFLAAVARLPECGGVALGIDRLAMLATGAQEISDVLLFPAAEF